MSNTAQMEKIIKELQHEHRVVKTNIKQLLAMIDQHQHDTSNFKHHIEQLVEALTNHFFKEDLHLYPVVISLYIKKIVANNESQDKINHMIDELKTFNEISNVVLTTIDQPNVFHPDYAENFVTISQQVHKRILYEETVLFPHIINLSL